MGKKLTEIITAVTKAEQYAKEEWDDVMSYSNNLEALRKSWAAAQKKRKSENDAGKKKKIETSMLKMRDDYQKTNAKRFRAVKSFREWANKYYRRFQHLDKHIQERERNSRWRSKKHTKEAKELLRHCKIQDDIFNGLNGQTYKMSF